MRPATALAASLRFRRRRRPTRPRRAFRDPALLRPASTLVFSCVSSSWAAVWAAAPRLLPPRAGLPSPLQRSRPPAPRGAVFVEPWGRRCRGRRGAGVLSANRLRQAGGAPAGPVAGWWYARCWLIAPPDRCGRRRCISDSAPADPARSRELAAVLGTRDSESQQAWRHQS